MVDIDHEQRVRAACFVAIGQMQHVHGDVLSIDVIRRGVVIEGERIALVNPYKGIHKPRQLNAALAVTTTPPASTKDAPYDDRMGDDGLYVYHYRTAGSGFPTSAPAGRTGQCLGQVREGEGPRAHLLARCRTRSVPAVLPRPRGW